MKIAFLTRVFSYGGAEMSTIELAQRIKKNHEIKFFDIYGCSSAYLDALKENNIELNLLLEPHSAYIINKHKSFIINSIRYFFYIFKWYHIKKIVQTKLSEYQADVVLVYDQLCLSYLISLKKKKIKVFFFARTWFVPNQISYLTKIMLKKFTDKIICVSEATRYAMFCGSIASLEKLFVLHNSLNENIINHKKEHLNLDENTFKIIHSGGFLPSKGQHVALEAAKHLKDMNFDFHLFLCGIIYPGKGEFSKKYYNSLIKYIELNKLHHNVTLVMGRSNIISYIKACDILYFPSSTEGLPRSILEAMILGKPVIANAVGGVTDLILDRFTGLITRYNDPIDYANYAILLKQNNQLYQDISGNAYNLIKTSFSEKLQMSKINELLR